MTTTEKPTGTVKVLYDHPDAVAQTIREFAERDPEHLRELALNLLDDVEECKRVIAVCYERLDQLTAAPTTFALPEEPPPEVTELWDREGCLWLRGTANRGMTASEWQWSGGIATEPWHRLLAKFGPLSTVRTTEETP